MSKSTLVLAAVLSVGLSAAWGAEVREKTSPPSPDRSQIESRVRQYAESLLKQYDKNKNGVLEKDEWSQMPERWRGADRNGDGKITLDELVARLAETFRGSPPRGRMPLPYQPAVSSPPSSFPPSSQSESRGVGPSIPLDRMWMSETFKMPDKPLDPHAPMVEMRILVAELAADGAAKTAAAAGPAKAGGKPAGSAKPGGLVELDLTAPAESLKDDLAKIGFRGRWESFYSVQLASAEGQTAHLNLGQSRPYITGVTSTSFGRTNSISYHNTGFIVGVQPRVDRGGIVTVQVDVNGSRIGSGEEGVPMFVSPEGEKIVSHPVEQMISRSIVRVPQGKTIVVARVGREEQGRRREMVILLSAQVCKLKAK
jgi:hypothetical protein